jgi:endonuclease/exonuclease/phosphatase family metal-dependent hydrolase
MSFVVDPYAPYGPLVETTVRVVAWNVWSRYGDWERRQAGLEDLLAGSSPDVVCLVEAWSMTEGHQAERIASRLGVDHSLFVGDWEVEDWVAGLGVVSRWPIAAHERRRLPAEGGDGDALFVHVEGPRGPIQLFVVALDYPLGASRRRQIQVRQLGEFVQEKARRRHPIVVCGDFNAGPDADEMRMLTGRSETVAPELVFYDAWEIAGDGTPGYTWSNRNPLAAVGLYPDRRFDYILSAWPRAGGVGHPVHCELLGVTESPDQLQVSDHYGVLADLRY